MADLNLNELRKVAERLAHEWADALALSPGRYRDRRIACERAIIGDHFRPEVVLALLDRVAELEAVVARVEALSDKWDDMADKWPYAVWHDNQKANARNLRDALTGGRDE